MAFRFPNRGATDKRGVLRNDEALESFLRGARTIYNVDGGSIILNNDEGQGWGEVRFINRDTTYGPTYGRLVMTNQGVIVIQTSTNGSTWTTKGRYGDGKAGSVKQRIRKQITSAQVLGGTLTSTVVDLSSYSISSAADCMVSIMSSANNQQSRRTNWGYHTFGATAITVTGQGLSDITASGTAYAHLYITEYYETAQS